MSVLVRSYRVEVEEVSPELPGQGRSGTCGAGCHYDPEASVEDELIGFPYGV